MIWWDLITSLQAHLQTNLPDAVVAIGSDATTPRGRQINIIRGEHDQAFVESEQRKGIRKYYVEVWASDPDTNCSPTNNRYSLLAAFEDEFHAALKTWRGTDDLTVLIKVLSSRPDGDVFAPATMNEWELAVEWYQTKLDFLHTT